MRSLSKIVSAISLAAVASCQNISGPAEIPHGNGRHVLFIGNSLTYYNDLPAMVQALADSAGDSLVVGMVAYPNVALVDHWNEGASRPEIRRGGWAIVVLQQGPSSVAVNRDSLRLWTGEFNKEIVAQGGRTALFSVWPTVDRFQDFPRAIESYELAAADVGGLLFPVASAWLAAWKRDATLSLYDGDGLHPSILGSYLAALVMFAKIENRSPLGSPAAFRLRDGTLVSVDPRAAAILQAAAAEVTRIKD